MTHGGCGLTEQARSAVEFLLTEWSRPDSERNGKTRSARDLYDAAVRVTMSELFHAGGDAALCETEGAPPIRDAAVRRLRELLRGAEAETARRAPEEIGTVYEELLDYTAVRIEAPRLGLRGSKKNPCPTAPLAELEKLRAESEQNLIAGAAEITGRREISLRNEYRREPDSRLLQKLRRNCGPEIARRAAPFLNWIREDTWGNPLFFPEGAFALSLGLARQRTGAHYTPRELAAMIVARTLEPAVYDGPAEGAPREEWRVKSPEQLLSLKICDPAMGAGAFLAEACRYVGARLAESWEAEEKAGRFVDVRGEIRSTPPREEMPAEPRLRNLLARRLAAERTLYGVDVNPTAVEIAKRVIRLLTAAEGEPPVQLDRHFRSGDALLGVIGLETRAGSESGVSLRRLADLRTALDFASRPGSKRDAVRLQKYLELGAPEEAETEARRALNLDRPAGTPERVPFHWGLEFPEVFGGGFDAVIGNPPFMGGHHISGNLGTAYRDYLVRTVAGGVKGSADLAAYFFLRAFALLKDGGTFGLLASNTISENETRQVGLERLVRNGAEIYAAEPNLRWPGTASVMISPVFVMKGKKWRGSKRLGTRTAETISPFLSDRNEWTPKPLEENRNQVFQGSIILGLGFTLSETEAAAYIAKSPRYRAALSPYLNGDELNSDPDQKPSRWVINFWDWPLTRESRRGWFEMNGGAQNAALRGGTVPKDYPGYTADDFPELLEIVRAKVKPQRDRVKRKHLRVRWWQYAETRPALCRAVGRAGLFARRGAGWKELPAPEFIYAATRHTKYFVPIAIRNDAVFSEAAALFTVTEPRILAALLSAPFEMWTRKQGSSITTGFRFTPTDCYETYPFPKSVTQAARDAFRKGAELRRALMTKRRLGLTPLYNLYHSPNVTDGEIEKLREYQQTLDEEILKSYGWSDIELRHGFHRPRYLLEPDTTRWTAAEDARVEILRRLLELNGEYWKEEQGKE